MTLFHRFTKKHDINSTLFHETYKEYSISWVGTKGSTSDSHPTTTIYSIYICTKDKLTEMNQITNCQQK